MNFFSLSGSLGAESIPRQEGYLEGSLIYTLEARPTPQCHASTLAETSEGLVAAWFGGTHEKHPDVGIWLSRRIGGRWPTPIEVANGIQKKPNSDSSQRHPCWNPVLFQPRTGPLVGPDYLRFASRAHQMRRPVPLSGAWGTRAEYARVFINRDQQLRLSAETPRLRFPGSGPLGTRAERRVKGVCNSYLSPN